MAAGDDPPWSRAPAIRYHSDVTAIVPSGPPRGRGLDGLRARIAELEAELDQRGAEVARAESDLAAFKIRYRQEVGLLHEQLDELELAIAEAELGELARRVEGGAGGPAAPPAGTRPEPQPRYTSDAVRRLFRDVAKAIHPDLADDEHARHRRHALMVEANRAYALGDEERLRSILQSWERSPEAVQGSDAEAMRLRLVRRIAQLEEQVEACTSELAELEDSPLWKLKVMVDDASARGRDLVGDMVRRLKRDIMVARNRLDAIQSHP
jgi:hypothetical protein